MLPSGASDEVKRYWQQQFRDMLADPKVVERLKAHLAEVSLVTFGAYGDLASVTGMRDFTDVDSPRLDAAREILAKLKV